MIKTLIKKQMMEMFSFFWRDKKKNIVRTGRSLVLWVILYIVMFAVIAGMFLSLALIMCPPLVAAGMDWLYFAVTGLVAVALGAFGSVFNTYASVYLPKDNSMLLAMPIKPSVLLLARLCGVYAMGLLYEVLVMIPVLGVYYVVAKPGVVTVILSLLITLVLSVFILTLSTVLGWVVALVSSKMKNKSMLTVALSLIFIAIYYYFFGMANTMLQKFLAAPQIAADMIKGRVYPLYLMGQGAQGDVISFLIFSSVILALFAVVYFVLTKTYRKILTTHKGAAKKVYREQTVKEGNADTALFGKEFRRFVTSPNYMLNCGLGVVIMVIAAVAVLIKGQDLITSFGGVNEILCLLACVVICAATSMNDITAPSVSLEGKNIWLLQSYPVSGWQVLFAKLKFHLVMTLIPAFLLTACVLFVMKPEITYMILIPIVVVLFVLLVAELGLVINLKTPNLNWTDEIIPIKQSMGVMIVLFGSWVILLILSGGFVLLHGILPPVAYLICVAVLLSAVSAAMYWWLKNTGAKIFESL